MILNRPTVTIHDSWNNSTRGAVIKEKQIACLMERQYLKAPLGRKLNSWHILYSNFVFIIFKKRCFVIEITICHQQCKCYVIRKTKLQTNKKTRTKEPCRPIMPSLSLGNKLIRHVSLVNHLWFELSKTLSTYRRH